MDIFIKKIEHNDYLFYSEMNLPSLGIYHVRNCQIRGGIILGAYSNEKIVGIVIAELMPHPRLTYLLVKEGFRRQNIGKQLIRVILTHLRGESAVEAGACVVIQNKFGNVCDHILRKEGFELAETATIIRYIQDERCKSVWNNFMNEKGDRIRSVLLRRGFNTLSFSAASKETFSKLKASMGTEFVSNLDPFRFVSNHNDRLVPDYSFITLKGDEPVAFVTVTTVDSKSLVLQQLSIAYKYQGSGVFLLPFAAFMERFLSGDGYRKMAAIAYDNNEKIQRMVHGLVGQLADSVKMQNIYQCKLEIQDTVLQN